MAGPDPKRTVAHVMQQCKPRFISRRLSTATKKFRYNRYIVDLAAVNPSIHVRIQTEDCYVFREINECAEHPVPQAEHVAKIPVSSRKLEVMMRMMKVRRNKEHSHYTCHAARQAKRGVGAYIYYCSYSLANHQYFN